MEKILKQVPLVLLLSFVGKMLFTDATLAQMGITFALSGIVALQEYLEKQSAVQEMKAVVAKQNEVIEKLAKDHVELRTAMGTFKMQQGMKRVG